ncbi:polysaccharide deacetylase family protein [Hyalangium minutum]|uniref:Polysaccharide deacetylase domain protein n=1 Tax=Hyalangium minutum TaxID=394096 RepID=A0A085VTY9_9BACT|nr:polysaccharide deacetylase family protein [Hyalangium minutum]KFE58902.1 polysaccharide deacetylase domain protein [Hyalangium minutum]
MIPPGVTVITFSFADTKKSQTRVGPLFARYGMHSTFYLSSGRIGHGSGYLSLADVRTLAAAGHEMASHTIDHVNLERVSLEEARHQICDDRANLMAMGLQVSSFSYPFGEDTPAARQVLIDCNFTNAQSTGGLRNPHSCATCPPVETIPPLDGFRIRSPPSIKSDWTLRDLQELVLQAEAAGGGWVLISLHDICDECDTYTISEPLLESFLAWLAPRASRGTVVLTMQEVLGGAVKPPLYADGGTFLFDAGTSGDGEILEGGFPGAGVLDEEFPSAGMGGD